MGKFLRNLEYYTRENDFLKEYFEQTATYFARKYKKPITVVKEHMAAAMGPGGVFEYKDRTVTINARDRKTGDKVRATIPLSKLFEVIRKYKFMFSPSMTAYVNADEEESLLASFILDNVAARGKVKKQMAEAQAIGDKLLADNKKNEQTSLKTRNNALSGAHVSMGTILHNYTQHSTLTSICRSATAYGNANNEKLLSGTRHYYSPESTIININTIVSVTDMEEFQACVDKYKLKIPSVNDVMDVINHSVELFWISDEGLDKVRETVEYLVPIERAAVVYIGDLYHTAKYNPDVVRPLLAKFTKLVDTPLEDYAAVEKELDGDTEILLSLLYSKYVGAKNLSKLKQESIEDYKIVMHGAKQLLATIEDNLDFFRPLFFTKVVPASVARLPDTVRRVSLVSDTDSTMATSQWWVEWCFGDIEYGQEADAIADVVTYIAVQNIAHMMALMSANMGVVDRLVFKYAMKNEYKFASFALTNKAKHYCSAITNQEGTAKPKPELEMKGVILRSSNIPPEIMSGFRKLTLECLLKVKDGEKISLTEVFKHIADIERKIKASIIRGESDYLKTGQIRDKAGYTNPESSAYRYYDFWEATFGRVYGSSGKPPYNIVKLPVDLENKTAMKKWLAEMENRELANRIETICTENKWEKFNNFLLPETVVSNGVPKEILEVTNFRKLIFNTVEPYYHMLESMGYYCMNKNRYKLISDYY